MLAQRLTDPMRRLVDELKRRRRQKTIAASRGRAIDCMELEDRILLSASPMAAETARQQGRGRRPADGGSKLPRRRRGRARQPRDRLVEPEHDRHVGRLCPAI